jgi:hypothetical protein
MQRSSVVFPDPDVPISATTSRSFTLKSMPKKNPGSHIAFEITVIDSALPFGSGFPLQSFACRNGNKLPPLRKSISASIPSAATPASQQSCLGLRASSHEVHDHNLILRLSFRCFALYRNCGRLHLTLQTNIDYGELLHRACGTWTAAAKYYKLIV